MEGFIIEQLVSSLAEDQIESVAYEAVSTDGAEVVEISNDREMTIDELLEDPDFLELLEMQGITPEEFRAWAEAQGYE